MWVDLAQGRELWELFGLENLHHIVGVETEARQHMRNDPSEKEWGIGRKVGTDLFHRNRQVLQGTIVA